MSPLSLLGSTCISAVEEMCFQLTETPPLVTFCLNDFIHFLNQANKVTEY